MIKKINHITVAVFDIEKSIKVYEDIFGKKPEIVKTVEEHGVKAAMYDIGGVMYELIQPLDLDSPIGQFLDNRGGNAMHHISFSVDDLNKAIEYYKEKGFKVIGEPKIGAEGKPIIFIHPKSTDGILMELIED